jgi:hypothetical protein
MIQERQGNKWTHTCDEGVSILGSLTVRQGGRDASNERQEEDGGELHFGGEKGYVLFA